METLQTRPSGVYRDEAIKALYVPVEFAEADSGDMSMGERFAAIAEEVSLRSLYAMQAITLVAAIISVMVLSSTDGRMVFAAASLIIGFLAIVVSAGLYLIAVKTRAIGARS